jgi:trans-aconitate 2-methyltransferase
MSTVAEFYDDFSSVQTQTGINHRHISVAFHLEKAGLRKTDKVLEVGCGIGTVSQLILRYLAYSGTLLAVDISSKSIDLAKKRNAKYSNANFEVHDLTKHSVSGRFNAIVLPDVLEHIP